MKLNRILLLNLQCWKISGMLLKQNVSTNIINDFYILRICYIIYYVDILPEFYPPNTNIL